MKIALGHDRFTVLDEEDADLASVKWHTQSKGYAANRGKGLLHRIVLERVLGRPLADSERTDHINRDRLDNRRSNLRVGSDAQNQANSPRHDGVSGYKGVCWDKDKRKWRAQIEVNGHGKHIGYFDNQEAAAQAYDDVALAAWGGWAYLNFPRLEEATR